MLRSCLETDVVPCCSQVQEETGFDLSDLINVKDKIQTQVNAQVVTMFMVNAIDEQTVFATQTRMEIGVRLISSDPSFCA